MNAEAEDLNSDHVPPKRLFATEVRRQHNPSEFRTLPTHKKCNTAAERDEAYFIVSFAGHCDSDVARAVMRDIGAKAARGEGLGLLREVISRFGKVVGPNGQVLFSYDTNRVDAFLWKVARGIYALETGGLVLPTLPPFGISLMHPRQNPAELAQLQWFAKVRNTHELGRYGGVFDYKWLCWRDGKLRGHAMAMKFWDRLLGAMLFHDPTCQCGQCEDWKQGRLPVRSQGAPNCETN